MRGGAGGEAHAQPVEEEGPPAGGGGARGDGFPVSEEEAGTAIIGQVEQRLEKGELTRAPLRIRA